jgi:hypothetical protein
MLTAGLGPARDLMDNWKSAPQALNIHLPLLQDVHKGIQPG